MHARSLHVRLVDYWYGSLHPDGTRVRVDYVTSIARYAVRSAHSRRSVSAISVLSNCNYVHGARQGRRVYLWRAGGHSQNRTGSGTWPGRDCVPSTLGCAELQRTPLSLNRLRSKLPSCWCANEQGVVLLLCNLWVYRTRVEFVDVL